LKPKLPVKKVQEQFKNYFNKKIDLIVTAEEPDPNLYYFEGTITILDKKTNVVLDVLKLGLNNFLPRGAMVCNSEIYALIVYTGKDSKIILN